MVWKIIPQKQNNKIKELENRKEKIKLENQVKLSISDEKEPQREKRESGGEETIQEIMQEKFIVIIQDDFQDKNFWI